MIKSLTILPGSQQSHIHSREEESFLVLEGEMTFQLGDDRFVAGEGSFLNMPVGSLHCFKNESDKTARLLITFAPAGLEEMFFKVGTPLEGDQRTAPPPSEAEINKLLEPHLVTASKSGCRKVKSPKWNNHE